MYKLIEALRLEKSNAENSVVRLQAGQQAPAANAACRQKELRLQTFVGSFSEERLSDYVLWRVYDSILENIYFAIRSSLNDVASLSFLLA